MTALWVATADGLHVVGEERSREFEGREINALARDGSSWWAIVDQHELWRRADGWERVTSLTDGRANCVSLDGPDVFVGASNASLFRLHGDALGPVEGFDKHPDRSDWYTPWGGPPDVRSIAHDNNTTFVNVHVGGILRSDDAGETWTQIVDIHSDVHEVIARDGLALAATAWGLGISRDGSEWEFVDDGLHASYARAVTLAGDTIVMSASTGPGGDIARLYRRPLSGGSFERVGNGLPDHFGDNIDTGCVAASGQEVAFATEDGRVFRSDDEGISWEQVVDGLSAARWVAFA